MESKLKKEKHSRVVMTVTATEEELKTFEAAALKHLAAHAKIQGFRPGKAPEAKIRETVGAEGVRARVIEQALPSLYAEAVTKGDVKPIARPRTSILKLEPLTVEFAVDVYPEVKVAKVEKIKLKKEPVAVLDGEMEATMKDLRERFRTFKPVTRVAHDGDRLEVSFTGAIEGKNDPRLASQHHPVIIGAKSFIDGFEEQLIGVKIGDTKDVTVSFPADYRAVDLRGKQAVFHVTVETLEEVELPPMDDALAVRATGRADATIAKLTEDIRSSILEEKTAKEDDRLERALMEALVQHTTTELPAALVEDEIAFFLHDLKERIEGQGLKFEHYLEIQRTTEEKLKEQFRPEAEKRLTARLALMHLADERKIEVSDDELNGALSAVEPGHTKDQRFREQLRQQLRLTKIVTELRTAAVA